MSGYNKGNKTAYKVAADYYYTMVHEYRNAQRKGVDALASYNRFLDAAKQLAIIALENPFLEKYKELEAASVSSRPIEMGPGTPEGGRVTGVYNPEEGE